MINQTIFELRNHRLPAAQCDFFDLRAACPASEKSAGLLHR
jgi:hypothetical protein